jgi:ribonuclease BN (tRNA processing enzyme)
MRLTPLGTNGFYPSHGRQTMSFLVAGRSHAVLLDAGTGVGRLAEPAVAAELAGRDELHVLLTHYHLDHLVGLSYLTDLWSGGRLVIHAPGRPLVDAEPRLALGRLLGPPLFPVALDEFPYPVEVRPYRDRSLALGEFKLELRSQTHPGRSVAVRVDRTLAYLTDTAAEPWAEEFCRGVELLLHELWMTDEEAAARPQALAGHSALSQVATIANRAEVGRLAPVHHHPRRTIEDLEVLTRDLKGRTSCPVEILREGTPIELA